MIFLSSEIAYCFYKSTMRPCMWYCFHDWVGAPSSSLNIWDKLQKWECRSVNHSIETLPHCLNVAILSLFCWYCFGRCSSELAELFSDPLVILIGCMIFLSPFLGVLRMSMSAVSFLAQIDCEIICLQNAFPWLIIAMVLKKNNAQVFIFCRCF